MAESVRHDAIDDREEVHGAVHQAGIDAFLLQMGAKDVRVRLHLDDPEAPEQRIVEIGDGAVVWIGGCYDDQVAGQGDVGIGVGQPERLPPLGRLEVGEDLAEYPRDVAAVQLVDHNDIGSRS